MQCDGADTTIHSTIDSVETIDISTMNDENLNVETIQTIPVIKGHCLIYDQNSDIPTGWSENDSLPEGWMASTADSDLPTGWSVNSPLPEGWITSTKNNNKTIRRDNRCILASKLPTIFVTNH